MAGRGEFEGGATPRGQASFFGRRRLQTPTEALQPDVPPPPPRKPQSKRRPILSGLSGFLSFLLLVAVLGIGGLAEVSRRLEQRGPLAADRTVYIPPRTDVAEIIDQLEKATVIDSPLLMRGALVAEQKWRDVKAGEFLFPQQASLQDVIDILVSGRQVQHRITVPEGLTSQQIVQRLRDNELLAGDIRDIPPEGSLLPETYQVTRGMNRANVIAMMQAAQTRLLNQIWERRASDLPLKSQPELVTLASIVEKETGRADERSRVAAVFHNRLQRRMRLQSDPTIVYGIVGGIGTLGRPIQRGEITRPTRYNTYVIDGLPPGPIANPGRAAMEAVANPSKTRDVYFVADGTGGHAFADSLEQHNRNVSRWREVERDAKARATAGQAEPPRDTDRVAPDEAVSVVEPPAPTAPRPVPQRRTELDQTFGGLRAETPSRTKMEQAPVVAFLQQEPEVPAPASRSRAREPSRDHGLAAVGAATRGAPASAAPVAGVTAFAPFTSVDQLGLVIRGVNDRATAGDLDGPATDVAGREEAPEAIPAVPLSPARRAEQEARMARFSAAVDTAPLAHAEMSVPSRPRIIDASEGTKFDPLRNTTYDLNSQKIVPSFRTAP